MPLFDFKCVDCGFVVKDIIFGRFSDREEIGVCPTCGGKLEKLISRCSFRMGKMSSDRSSTPGRATCVKV